MIKLKNIYNEVRLVSSPTNQLRRLQALRSSLKTAPPSEQRLIAIQCAKLVLPIWRVFYPGDDRPAASIAAAERYAENPSEENRQAAEQAGNAAWDARNAAWDAGDKAAAFAAHAAWVTTYADAYAAADKAIHATKLFFKIK